MSRTTGPRTRGLRAAWIILGVVVLALVCWVAWLYLGTTRVAEREAARMRDDFRSSCPAGEQTPVVGLLDLGQGTQWPIVEGVGDDDIAHAVGWYPGTAAPGTLGNTALTAHLATHGAPFAHLSDLNVGNKVTIITCNTELTYEIVVAPRDLTVAETDDWVLDAVPGSPGEMPTASMLTLITSQDLVPSADRSVGFAKLLS